MISERERTIKIRKKEKRLGNFIKGTLFFKHGALLGFGNLHVLLGYKESTLRWGFSISPSLQFKWQGEGCWLNVWWYNLSNLTFLSSSIEGLFYKIYVQVVFEKYMQMNLMLKRCSRSFKNKKKMQWKHCIHWDTIYHPSDHQNSTSYTTYSAFETVGKETCSYFEWQECKMAQSPKFPQVESENI